MMTGTSPKPVDLKLRRDVQELRIRWQDGRESVYPARQLRKNCPCATCRVDREKQSTELLPVLRQSASGDVKITGAKLVGAYAVQLHWSDGHDTGIFDFKFLRSLDPG